MNGYISWFRKSITAVVCIVFVLYMCSCGGKQEAVDIFNDTSHIPSASELPLPQTTQNGDDLQLHMNLPEISTLHPLVEVTEDVANIFSLIFDPAIKINEDSSYSANVIERWEISEDELEYTFYIRKNVAFHDASLGTVDADDLLYCLEFIINEQTAAMHKYADGIESYEKIDDLTFKVRTTEKKRNLLFLFSFYVIPKDYYISEANITTSLSVGTGAYIMQSYTANEKMVLIRNDAWWKTQPIYQMLELTPVDEKEIALGSSVFEKYELLFTEKATAGNLGISGKINVNRIRTPFLSCLIPNVYNNVMDDENFRKAIAYGIDRNDLISSAMMGLGEATLTPLNDNFWAISQTAYVASVHDDRMARELLQQAGYLTDEDGWQYKINADGTRNYLTIRLLYTASSKCYDTNRAVAQEIKQDLEKIGIKVNLIRKEAEEYLNDLQEGNFQIALCQFYIYQDQNIQFLFEESYNYGNFYDSSLNEILKNCREAVSQQAIQEAYTKLQNELQEKMPIIGLYYEEHCLLSDASIDIPLKLSFSKLYQNINEWKKKE